MIEFIAQTSHPKFLNQMTFSLLKKVGWIWLFMMGIAVTEVKSAPSSQWNKLEILSKSFTKQDSLSLGLTGEEWKMISALDLLPYSTTLHKIYKNQGSYYVMNDCELAIYTWKEGQWKLFSGKDVTGANCGTTLFFKEKELYGQAGFGYWQNHGDLFRFPASGEVEFIKTFNQPEDFLGNMNFTTAEGYYSFFGQQINLRKGLKDFLWKGFFLDFRDWTWREVEFDLNENFEKVLGRKSFDNSLNLNATFETDDYAFSELLNIETTQACLFIVKKETLEMFIIPFTPHQFEGVKKWIRHEGNRVQFSTFFKTIPSEVQIDQLVQSALPLGKVILKKGPTWSALLDSYWKALVGVISILVVLFGLGKVILPKPHPIPPASLAILNKEENNLVSILRPYSGQVISQEEMDKILGIDSIINQDLRKVRRSRAIKAINDHGLERHGKPMIQRVRDEQDMRIIRYLIEDEALAKSVKPSESEQLT